MIDAIIVPTARSARHLGAAIGYAKELDCTLLVLCSQDTSITDVEWLAKVAGIELVAIDTSQLPSGLLPAFETTEFGLVDPRDTATKRNVALLFAQLAGWQRIVFLDDDISVEDPQLLSRAAAALDSHEAIGLQVVDFPDNSVVCHAGRRLGWPQQTFIGAGALAVHVPSSTRSFFPQVYNEDWFFLLGDNGLRRAAILGEAKQTKYDPFADPRRAGFEEFGDALAEGIFWALDNGGDIADASVEHWRMFLASRREFIDGLLARLEEVALDEPQRGQIRAALRAALERNATIDPQFCVDYVKAWRNDRDQWYSHVNARQSQYLISAVRASPASTAEKVLAELGLVTHARYVAKSVVTAADQPPQENVALL
ncbi:MAG TPA: hypothetical protein VHZ97_06835 [Pseudonocardiaceae bacterium]|nr:hypothetical protein [Pseudonocardiaceae bacterium]